MFFILLIKKILLLTHLCTVTSMLDDLSYGYINNIVRRDHTSLKKWCWPCTDWLCFAWIAFALLFQINSSYQENNENDNGFLFQDKKFIETFDMIVVSNSSFICTVGQKKNGIPLLILIKINVENWNLYQSTWIIVCFNLIRLFFFRGLSTWGVST